MDGSKPVVLNITGEDTVVLKQISSEVETVVKSVEGITDVNNSLQASKKDNE
ncbi:hypothetical protein [Desulfosporosinus fructosivorans]